MTCVGDVVSFLDSYVPAVLAESWDNVGLLLGDRADVTRGVMTCLTLSPDVAEEAIRERAGLVVTHHPILFRPVQRLTTDTSEGAMLLALARTRTSVYSPHTAFDSAAEGVNARLCQRLELTNVGPLRPTESPDETLIGAGRIGRLAAPIEFSAFAERVKEAFRLPALEAVSSRAPVLNVAVACGAAAEFLPDAAAAGCDVLVTGEARFHAALEARTRGIGLVLLGHYASERFAVEELAGVIGSAFPGLTVWASRAESDPIQRF